MNIVTSIDTTLPTDPNEEWEEITIIKRRKKKVQPDSPKVDPKWPVPFPTYPIPMEPVPVSPIHPWVTGTEQPCAIEEFFKQHPDAQSVSMVCFCPRCTIRC